MKIHYSQQWNYYYQNWYQNAAWSQYSQQYPGMGYPNAGGGETTTQPSGYPQSGQATADGSYNAYSGYNQQKNTPVIETNNILEGDEFELVGK